MSPHVKNLSAALLVMFLAAPAWAQELGLDLSDTPALPPPAYRPVIGILGATSSEPAGDTVTASRAKLVEFELARLAKQNEAFQSVVEPSTLSAKLGPEAASAQKCADWQCMEKLAQKLGVHRLISATVAKSGVGSAVTIKAYDPTSSQLQTFTQDSGEKPERTFAGVGGKSQVQKDREFIKKMAGFFVTTLGQLTTANAKLIIDNPDPSAMVSVDGVDVGLGNVELILVRGPHTVHLKSDTYLPFEQLANLEAGKDLTVKITLIAKPLDPSVIAARRVDSGPTIFTRPGLYLAAAGLAAIIGGVVVGQQAKAVAARAVPDGNGIVPITRAEALAARSNASLANVLVGAGAAAAAGGGVWFFMTAPTKGSTGGGSTEPGETATMIGVGGSF